MTGLFDRFIDWLMRPKVRRVRRWSFVATFPLGLLIAHLHGLQEGIAIVAARLALSVLLALVAWRLGGERGEALRDLLMHPRGRAFARAELDVLSSLPRLVLGRICGSNADGLSYAHGTFGFALALAFTPMVAGEAITFHLLLGGGIAAWVLTGLHVYTLIWLWGYALGPRAYPHRIGPRTAVLRGGPMHRVLVPRSQIVAATAHRERVSGRGLVQRKGAVLLPVRGRVEVTLELAAPVRVQRPFHEPLVTTRLSIASDDPDALIARLLAPAPITVAADRRLAAGAPLFGFELAGLVRDGAQPG